MNSIIQTMINQFCVNLNRLKAMIGANSMCYDNNNNSLYFSFKMCRKANKCTLLYNSDLDLYAMKFYKYNSRTADIKEVEQFDGLYADQLKPVFESFTGLYISL